MAKGWIDKALDVYAFGFARRAFFPIHRAMFRVAARGMGIRNLGSMRLSGELAAAEQVFSASSRPVVFDVGANEGHYSSLVLGLAPNATIHAFEPHPKTFARLSTKLGGRPKVALNNFALSDNPGVLTLYDVAGEEGTGLASVHGDAVAVVGATESVEVQVRTLDEYRERVGVERINFLKVDVEGHELAVLQGAKRTLLEGRVDRVQFEFNEMNVFSRTFVRDFFQLLEGFDFYRLLVDGVVPLGQYSPFYLESFAFQNVLAVRRGVPVRIGG